MKINPEQTISAAHFDDTERIDARVERVPAEKQASLRTTLSYLYRSDGPTDLARELLKLAEEHLDSAERIAARWLQTRTNGRLRRHFGSAALRAARAAKYRCESCGYADVRVLHLDNVQGRNSNSDEFACLCANCHTIKSRAIDWQLPTDD